MYIVCNIYDHTFSVDKKHQLFHEVISCTLSGKYTHDIVLCRQLKMQVECQKYLCNKIW